MSFICLREFTDFISLNIASMPNRHTPDHLIISSICFLFSISILFCAVFDSFFKSVLGNLLFDLPTHFFILMKIFSICKNFNWSFFKSSCSFFKESNSFLIVLHFFLSFYPLSIFYSFDDIVLLISQVLDE